MQNFDAYKVMARLGYAARGVIYLTIGGLAFLSVMGGSQDKSGSRGAILNLKSQPFGEVLLIALVVGLVGYIMWRLIQALNDADNHGRTLKGVLVRGGLFVSALSHGVLCYWIITLLLWEQKSGSGGSSSSPLRSHLSAETQAMVFGVVGVVMIGVGIAHLFKGYKRGFTDYMDFPASQRQWMIPMCQFGLMARGVVWCIIGWIITRSAVVAGGSDEKGMKEAFEWLSNSPYGSWLVTIVAVGLFAFGAYSCLETRYRRVEK